MGQHLGADEGLGKCADTSTLLCMGQKSTHSISLSPGPMESVSGLQEFLNKLLGQRPLPGTFQFIPHLFTITRLTFTLVGARIQC